MFWTELKLQWEKTTEVNYALGLDCMQDHATKLGYTCNIAWTYDSALHESTLQSE